MFFSNIGGNNTQDDSLYKELGIDKKATSNDIKKAYKKMALKYHPDRNKEDGAEERFKKISKAYDILSDESKRKQYDMFGLDAVNGTNGIPSGFSGGGNNPFDLFDNIFGNNHGMGPRGFNNKPTRRKARNVVKEITVDLVDIYNEKKLKLALSSNVKCSKCNGKGASSSASIKTCSKCDGSGVFVQIQQIGPGMISQSTQTCNVCRGNGKEIDAKDKCLNCGGTKTEKNKQIIEIQLNRTHKQGDKIRFDGYADYEPDSDSNGDLIIVLNETNSSNFIRIGNDLVYTKTISLLDSLCGMDLIIDHMDNRKLFIKTCEVIQPESIHKIDGEGMSIASCMYIKFKVIFPTRLSDERKAYIKKLIQPNSKKEDSINNTLKDKELKFLEDVNNVESDKINKKLNTLNSYNNNQPDIEQEEYIDQPPGCVHQ